MRRATDQRRRRMVVALSGAVLLVGAGAIVVGTARSTPTPGDTERHDDASGSADAARGLAPTGRPPADSPDRSSAGEAEAVTAAIAYAVMPQQWLYLTDDDVLAGVAEIATPGAADRIGREVLEEVRAARDRLARSPSAVWWVISPLAWRVESHHEEHATVAVWTVSVLSAPEVAVPQSEWATVTIDLAWVDGVWRLDAVRARPGPTPASGAHDDPWDARAFDDQMEGFTRVAGAEEPAG